LERRWVFRLRDDLSKNMDAFGLQALQMRLHIYLSCNRVLRT
jgi:hypothetical protein